MYKLICLACLIQLLSGCNQHQPTYSEARASYVESFDGLNSQVCKAVHGPIYEGVENTKYDECMAQQRMRFGELFDNEQREMTAAAPTRNTNSQVRSNNYSREHGTTVYGRDECIGAIVHGVCHGTILPKRAVHEKCYGEMLNGRCTGPQF